MSRVFVVDMQQQPLTPCTPARARWLLTQKKAAIWRRYPFTIIVKGAKPDALVPEMVCKLDPGSETTGIAVLNQQSGEVLWAGELTHRGQAIKERLDQRRGCRRSRCQRHTRYREPRFLNRTRPKGWLPPSAQSRVANIHTWVNRIRLSCLIASLSMELVKFDTQLMQHAEISGVEYQQGTLAGYETREYLLEKWNRACAYCGATHLPLQIEHIVPKSRGGSNRIANLAIACEACNLKKGAHTAEAFGFPNVQQQAQQPLKDAAAVNASRWAVWRVLTQTGLPVETGSGGLTKFNRTHRNLPKTHWLDASCVGHSTPETLHWKQVHPFLITAMGRHSRQMCRTNAFGVPDKAPKATSVVGGFRTGDMVKAVVPETSKKAGVYVGRIAIRATGYCNIKTGTETIQGIHVRYCTALHRMDGYSYSFKKERLT